MASLLTTYLFANVCCRFFFSLALKVNECDILNLILTRCTCTIELCEDGASFRKKSFAFLRAKTHSVFSVPRFFEKNLDWTSGDSNPRPPTFFAETKRRSGSCFVSYMQGRCSTRLSYWPKKSAPCVVYLYLSNNKRYKNNAANE